jgi:hypothetical protein
MAKIKEKDKIKINIPAAKKRNPFFNQKKISENLKTNTGPMKDKREGRKGSKNKQKEYLKDSESDALTPAKWKLIDEVPVVEDDEDEEEHEFDIL